MRVSSIILLLIFLFPSISRSENLSLEIEIEPSEVVLGVPFVMKLSLKSDTSFTLDGEPGFCDEHTKVIVKDSSGNPTEIAAFDCKGLIVQPGPFDSDAKKTYQGLVSTHGEMFLPVGTFRISAEYHSLGPYVDRYTDTDVRPVEGIWIGELTSNEVKVTVKNPEGEDQVAFQALRPSQEELPPPENELSWFLKLSGEQILQDYPKSNYAAWLLWKRGESNYLSFTNDDKLSIEDEFNFPNQLQEVGMTVGEYLPSTVTGILEPWERLTKEFPHFHKRPEVLKGLAQVYIRTGQRQKAIPLIKELLEKYPETEQAKKGVAYKEWMQQKNIWD